MASVDVWGRVPARALDYNVQQIGKTIAASKVRVTWTFVFEGTTEDHMVALVHSTVSGRKQVFVDGQIYHEEVEAVMGEWRFPFSLDGNKMQICIAGYPGSDDFYDFTINGLSFKSLPKTTMDRVREAKRRQIADEEARAQRIAQQGGRQIKDSTASFDQIVASKSPSHGTASKHSARRARAASGSNGHKPSLARASHDATSFDPFASDAPTGGSGGSGTGGNSFDPFGESSAPAGAPAEDDIFGTPAPAPAPTPAPAPAPARTAAADPFGSAPAPAPAPAAASSDPFGLGPEPSSTTDEDLASLNFGLDAPSVPTASTAASSGGTFGTSSVGGTPQNASAQGTGKNLVDLDNLSAPRAGAPTSSSKRAPSMAEMARVQGSAANGGKKPVMMSPANASNASPTAGGMPPHGGYGGPQHQHGAPMGYGAPQGYPQGGYGAPMGAPMSYGAPQGYPQGGYGAPMGAQMGMQGGMQGGFGGQQQPQFGAPAQQQQQPQQQQAAIGGDPFAGF